MTDNRESRQKNTKRLARVGISLLLILVMIMTFAGCGKKDQQKQTEPSAKTTVTEQTSAETQTEPQAGAGIDADGTYDSRDEVAAYIVAFGKLPSNYMTKKEARKLGWEGGSLERYAPGMCIGGDRFGNYERQLPDDEYQECDIDTLGRDSRGAKRLVYSDEAIYYTEDHYRSFEKVSER